MESNQAFWDPTSELTIYKGRNLIDRDRPIDGGVFYNQGEPEAIVVDSSKQSLLEVIYYDLLRDLRYYPIVGRGSYLPYLTAVYDITKQKLPYDLEGVNRINKSFPRGSKLTLQRYIMERAGICKHQAVLAGFLIERLIKEEILDGFVSVDWNRNFTPNRRYYGHAWVRYTDPASEVYIVDPAKNYVGLLRRVRRRWNYRRPDDPETPEITLIDKVAWILGIY